ncbi:MAG: GNAT family protein [Pseudomonadota bacterium]
MVPENLPLIDRDLTLDVLSDVHGDGPYRYWFDDEEITQYLEWRTRVTSETIRDYIAQNNTSDNAVLLGMFLTPERLHIGNIKIGPIDWYHGRGAVGLVIGDKSRWGQGYGCRAIQLVRHLAFDQLGLHKLYAGSLRQNLGSIKAFEKAGFEREATLHQHARLANGQLDDVIMLRTFAQPAD